VVAGITIGLGLAAGALSCGPPAPPPEAASAVLLTIDTWRADSFGAGGHPELRTPHLDRFFRGSLQFSEAFSPIPTTLASHVSMLTGAWPTEHGVPRNVWIVPDDLVTLPEHLADAGFSRAAFVSSSTLDRGTNVDQGFDVYDDALETADGTEPWRPAAVTLERARRWWEATGGRRFLWVHVFEPHLPYGPPPELAALHGADPAREPVAPVPWMRDLWRDKSRFTPELRRHLLALYHAEISGLDRRLGPFLAELAAAGDVATIVTSDHGEGLGEHNVFFTHGPKVFAGDVQVPLALRAPGTAAGVSGSAVRTIDVPGTLLGLLGVAAELPLDAEDLRDHANGGEPLTVFGVASAPANAPRALFEDGAYANSRMPRVIRRGHRSFLETPWQGRSLWFDRADDPAELDPRRPAAADSLETLKAELDAWILDARVTDASTELDREFEERMRALGYLD